MEGVDVKVGVWKATRVDDIEGKVNDFSKFRPLLYTTARELVKDEGLDAMENDLGHDTEVEV